MTDWLIAALAGGATGGVSGFGGVSYTPLTLPAGVLGWHCWWSRYGGDGIVE